MNKRDEAFVMSLEGMVVQLANRVAALEMAERTRTSTEHYHSGPFKLVDGSIGLEVTRADTFEICARWINGKIYVYQVGPWTHDEWRSFDDVVQQGFEHLEHGYH